MEFDLPIVIPDTAAESLTHCRFVENPCNKPLAILEKNFINLKAAYEKTTKSTNVIRSNHIHLGVSDFKGYII